MICKSLVLGSAVALLATAAPAAAVTFSFLATEATWVGGTLNNGGAPTINTINNTTSQVSWGRPAPGGQRSSYLVSANVFDPVEVTEGNPSAEFVFANFTHNNFPIFAPWLTNVQLSIKGDVRINNVLVGNKTFLIDFFHDETFNNPNPCKYGGANGVGINVNGCADRVVNVFNSGSDVFLVGNTIYSIETFQFRIGGFDAPVFDTVERQVNNAQLLGRVNIVANIPVIPPIFGLGVPEPATWAMLIAGFGLTGALQRRRRAVSVAA
ncbi:hypothetical protein IP88_09485 [alpha proteobacterium AAP81b]|nr:hypothetical protein IP88_09485 [alpha proteobacterium AAP81b]